jgi:hypothetical protein
MIGLLNWAGVLVCVLHSAIFSGLTIGFFGLSRLGLEIKAEAKDRDAARILNLRKDSNFLLATLLWGNVAANVLITLLTNSVLTGAGAFLFSTFTITVFGEIMPQAYFSRHALKVGSMFVPVIRFYQTLLYFIARPTSVLLDKWLGKEGARYFQEKELLLMLNKQINSAGSDVDPIEGTGASNFLKLDDIYIKDEGERIDEDSILSLPENNGIIQFPQFMEKTQDEFLQKIHESEKKWIIITNDKGEPRFAMDSDAFLRDAVYEKERSNPYHYCHRPVIVADPSTTLGQVLGQLKVVPEHSEDDVIDHDLILYWADQKKVITGADILGRLLRGIAKRDACPKK